MTDNKRFWDEQRRKRIDIQRKQYMYYVASEVHIDGYLKEALSHLFDSSTTNSMKNFYINFVKKIVDQKAIIYNKAAVRNLTIDGKVDADITKKYNKYLSKGVNLSNKTAVKMAVLSNTSLTQVIYDRDAEKLKYRVEPSYKYDVVVDDSDPYILKEVRYRIYNESIDQELDVVWTKDSHYYEDDKGNRLAVGDNVNMINPYNIIPFAVMRINDGEDFWGEGLNDIVNFNEILNLILTDLLDTGIIMGSATTPVGINLGLNEYIGKNPEDKKTLKLGMKHPLTVENADAIGKVAPSLTFVKPDVRIKEIMDEVERLMKIFAINHGLNPNSMTLNSNSSSGYSKMMDALDEIHIRESMIEQGRAYEEELFNISRRILNVHTKENFPDDLEVKVDFAEVSLPLSPQEWSLKVSEEFKFNLKTPVDFLIELNNDLTVEEAEAIIERNTKYNKSFEINDFIQATNVPKTETTTAQVNKQ